MVNFEIEKSYTGPVIGLDEVGRGPLAGPVISCGCIFTDYDYLQDKLKFIDDSKKITLKKRKLAFNHLLKLIKKNLLIYKLGMATVKEIDEMNILEATKLSMKRVIDKFNLSKANLIIDGNFKLNYKNYSEQSIIKGDQLSISIATASIIAKIHRDRLMTILSKKFTQLKLDFIVSPYVRFKGKKGEQATMFIKDPSENILEFKSFRNDKMIFDN